MPGSWGSTIRPSPRPPSSGSARSATGSTTKRRRSRPGRCASARPRRRAAWRNVAAARVRSGDLPGAIDAYRQADKRAPREDKAEIANRLGWLTKETGDPRAARRYFAAGRGDRPLVTVTLVLIAITAVVSLTAQWSDDPSLYLNLELNKFAVAAGEYWRLWTVALVHGGFHGDPIHLLLNMYALWIAGPIVERWYGRIRFLVFYLAFAAAASTASFVLGNDLPAVGASGAIFGLFGMLLSAGRLHHPVDRQSRALVSQIGTLIVINLVFGFAFAGVIDNFAHIGGLVAGLWMGALVVPTGVPTLSSFWSRPAGTPPSAQRVAASPLLELIGVAVVVAVVAGGVAVGTADRNGRRGPPIRPSRCRSPSSATRADARRRPPAQRAPGTVGKTTLTRAPCGATFSACAVPPWAVANSRTIARPRPLAGPVRAGSAR